VYIRDLLRFQLSIFALSVQAAADASGILGGKSSPAAFRQLIQQTQALGAEVFALIAL